MIHSNEVTFDILQLASRHFLITPIPDDWLDLSESAQNQFLLDHVWQPLEGYDAQSVWEHIESAEIATHNFILDRQGESPKGLASRRNDVHQFSTVPTVTKRCTME